MKNFSVRLVSLLVLFCSVASSQAATVVAIKSGNWGNPEIWSVKTLPRRIDAVIIPQGIIVSVIQPVVLAPSEDGKPMTIAVAGTLNIATASLYIDPIDRIMVMPGGKISSKSYGGAIFSGDCAAYLDGFTSVRGPVTLGDGFSHSSIADITTELDTDGTKIEWRSGADIEVNYYHILRSFDGITFDQIGKVDGRGSRKERLFSFVDQGHHPGTVYYRIDLTNNNGVGASVGNVVLNVGGEASVAPLVEQAPKRR